MEQVEREEAKLKRLVQMQEVVPQIMKRLEQGLETKREEEQIALKLIEEVDQKLTAPGLSHEKREELDNLKTGYEMDIQDFRDSSKSDRAALRYYAFSYRDMLDDRAKLREHVWRFRQRVEAKLANDEEGKRASASTSRGNDATRGKDDDATSQERQQSSSTC